MAEAAEGTQGAEGQATPGEQTQGEGEGEGSDPLAAIRDRMEETSARTLEMLESIQQGQQAQQPPEGEYPPDPYQQAGEYGQLDPNQQIDPQLAQGLYSPDEQQQAYAAQAMMQQFQGMQQGQAQLAQELQTMRNQMGGQKLEQQYPDLQDGEKAAALISEADQWAAQQGHPEIGRSPAVLEMLYLAGKAKEQAANENVAGEDTTTVESGAGAVPDEPETPPGQRIAEYGRSSDPGRQFWGG